MNATRIETQYGTTADAWRTWAVLTGTDSVVSLLAHRFRSALPDDLARDVEETYLQARREADRIKAWLDTQYPNGWPACCACGATEGRPCIDSERKVRNEPHFYRARPEGSSS